MVYDSDAPIHYQKHFYVFPQSFWKDHKNTLHKNNPNMESNLQTILQKQRNHENRKGQYIKVCNKDTSHTRHISDTTWRARF
jgi:hypothetical protein